MPAKPDFTVWLVTSRCNFRCSHCYSYDIVGELSEDEALKIAEELADFSTPVDITGGEPLLWKPLRSVVRLLRECDVDLSIQSNLSILDGDYAKFLSDLGVFIFTSLDGPSREVHDKLRGFGSWDSLIRSLKLLKGFGLDFATVTTITRVNLHVLTDVLKLSRELGASYAAFIPIIPIGRARYNDQLNIEPVELLNAVISIRDSTDALGFKAAIWCAPFLSSVGSTKYFYVGDCPIYRAWDILPDGSIPLCDSLRIKIADVKIGVSKAWEEYLASPLVKEVFTTVPEACRGCNYSRLCRGGCKARAYAVANSFSSPDPLCPLIQPSVQRITGTSWRLERL
ncbi:MAG: radical SAM protein [Candidatus Bathyarchaeia archaeon]